MEHAKKKHGGHGIKKSRHDHHHDGSMTHHFQHEDGPHADIKHASMGVDGMHDAIENAVGQANPGESEASAGQHGVPAEMASSAGLPAAPAPAAGGAPAMGM